MLTGDLVRPRLQIKDGHLSVRTIGPRYQQTAAELIALFQAQLHQPREAWDNALTHYEGERIDYIIIRGLAKVLSDAATFTPLPTPIPPSDLRQLLFAEGPVLAEPDLLHPISRQEQLTAVAENLSLTAEQVAQSLFADRVCKYILTDIGQEWTPDGLIGRYNLELLRGALYWAHEMKIEVYDSYKEIWRYLKLFKLMYWAAPLEGGGYQVAVDGPISPFVKATRRYGRQFAAFLPALFLCQRWQMRATVRHPALNEDVRYKLDNTVPFHSHFKQSGLYDSQWEANFAAEFEAKFGQERGQWRLGREDEVLLLGDTAMIPDFSLTHKKDGRRVLIEIVGFWHPDYLRRKLAKVRAAQRKDLILLVYQGLNLNPEKLEEVPGEVLYFKNKPVLKEVMAAAERIAVQ